MVVENVLGIQRGRDPNRFVIIGAHIDSRVTDVMDATKDAPGANDDGSGTAAVIEAAILSTRLHMLPADKIRSEMAYLAIAIEKTAFNRKLSARLLISCDRASIFPLLIISLSWHKTNCRSLATKMLSTQIAPS